jgi:hypothetical protein
MTYSRDSDPFFFDPEGEKAYNAKRRREPDENELTMRREASKLWAEMMRDDTDFGAKDVDS